MFSQSKELEPIFLRKQGLRPKLGSPKDEASVKFFKTRSQTFGNPKPGQFFLELQVEEGAGVWVLLEAETEIPILLEGRCGTKPICPS
ncbi:hypothetical protein Tcan_09311 [Toxocara canis]|uniref:Uncharacterized protein n=1 Tax=Toxocara canis TaxID=6265 RepID=A0A0B2V648_TOXCA|nr:hypothetical protein Tcan_09311 [Toxocara canis]